MVDPERFPSQQKQRDVDHMERRLALATACAASVTLGVGTVGYATIGGGNLLGMGGASGSKTMAPLTQVETITRVVVVHSADGSVVTDPAGVPVTVLRTVRVVRPVAGTKPAPIPATLIATTPATEGTPVATSATVATTTTIRPTTTTVKPTTPTTVKPAAAKLPPGVPADWPAGKPIPPMPAHCSEPQLELNGVWNCG